MKIIYSNHLKERLKRRNISEDYPTRIVNNAEEIYKDAISSYEIYILSLFYKGMVRKMVMVCDKIDKTAYRGYYLSDKRG